MSKLALSHIVVGALVCAFIISVEVRKGPHSRTWASGPAANTVHADNFDPDSEESYLAQVRAAEINGPEIPYLVSMLHNLAGFYERKGRYAESESVQRRALAIWEKAPGQNQRKVMSCHLELAALFSAQGKTSQANDEQNIALGLAKVLLGPSLSDIDNFARGAGGDRVNYSDPFGAALEAQSLARVFQKHGDFATAERLYKYALNTFDKFQSGQSSLQLSSLQGLAVLYREQGNSEEAAVMQKRLDATAQSLRGTVNQAEVDQLLSSSAEALLHSPLTAKDLETLKKLKDVAAVSRMRLNEKKAEPVARRILQLEEKQWGSDSPKLAEYLKNLIDIESSLGHLASAKALCNRYLAIASQSASPSLPNEVAPESEQVASVLSMLASVFDREKNFAEAIKTEKQSLAMRLKTGGPDQWVVGESYSRLGNFSSQANQFAEAEEFYLKGISICEKFDTPGASGVMCNLARFYLDRGSYAKSEVLYKRSCDLQLKQHGPDDPMLALATSDMGLLFYRQGKYEEALSRYSQALSVLEKSDDTVPMTPAILIRSANALEKLNRKAEASKLRARANALQKSE